MALIRCPQCGLEWHDGPDLLKELEQEYKLRPAWPKTPDTYFQISDDPGNREWPEPRTPENQSIFAEDSVTDRLRIMGIPEFSSITLIRPTSNTSKISFAFK